MNAYVYMMIEEGTRTELEEAFAEAIASRDHARLELAAKDAEIARLREALMGVRYRPPRGRETLWRLDTDLLPSEWEKQRIAAIKGEEK